MKFLMKLGGNGEACLGDGWSGAESDLIWAVGSKSRLTLPTGKLSRTCLLRLRCWPHTQPGLLDRQRVIVSVKGQVVGRFEMRVGRTLVAVIPAAFVAGVTQLEIVLQHPDNARPKDFPTISNGDDRRLAIAYNDLEIEELDAGAEHLSHEIASAMKRPIDPAATLSETSTEGQAPGLAATALSKLQSLGDDCEFGFVQRHYLLEPLSVFRFASINIDRVTAGIQCGLSDFAEDDNLEIKEHHDDPAHDYAGHETRYDVKYHTMRYPGEITKEALHTSETQRLRFLARKFMSDLSRGQHLFVVKRKDKLHPEEVALLLAAVRSKGPSQLLWVCEEDEHHEAGSAEMLLPGLLRGYVSRIDVSPLKRIDMASWAEMAQSACAVWRLPA